MEDSKGRIALRPYHQSARRVYEPAAPSPNDGEARALQWCPGRSVEGQRPRIGGQKSFDSLPPAGLWAPTGGRLRPVQWGCCLWYGTRSVAAGLPLACTTARESARPAVEDGRTLRLWRASS